MSTSTSRSKESLEKVPQRRYFQVRRQLDDAADAAQRRFDCQFVILDGLQSEEELQRLEANKINGYKSTEFPYNNQESSAKLDFTSNWQAIKAKVKLRKIIADLNINYVTAQQMNHHYSTKSISYLRKARIIVRNLPSNIKISQIKDHFSKFGAILEISIPNEGKSKGQFAFIQYTSKKESEIAVREMNLSEIYGRQIVVDIAVSKKDYDLHVQKMSKENSEDENDDNNQQSTIDNTQNIEHNNESKDIEVESADEESEDPEKKELNRPNDGAETPTLFVTKIAEHFDDSYLKTVFSEFGPVRYFNRMASRSTGQPTRRGFVQFVDSESLEKCLAEARSNKDTDDSNLPNIELKDGSRVNIFRAVSREKASELKQLNEFRQSKRNLNLATISSNY
ncbi:MAG: RNA-binding protein 28 [Marteilia pararefringens]